MRLTISFKKRQGKKIFSKPLDIPKETCYNKHVIKGKEIVKMKISYGLNDMKPFKLLVPGECFLYEETAYMRIFNIKTNYCEEFSAVDLSEGTLTSFTDNTMVTCFDGELIIK